MSLTLELEPRDPHNEKLLSHVHPPDWVNPQPAKRYNLVVIGAGTAGLVTAIGAAGLGAKVALIERGLMGGDCLNTGCVPSKALLRCARAAAAVRTATKFGVHNGDAVRVDFPAVMERMRRLRADISPHDSAARCRELGVDVFLGEGRFTGPGAIAAEGQTLRFRKAAIATGGHAAALPIPGLADVGYLTNETIFSLTELPPRLAIIGAGPIGCELAQCFARFGSQVTLIESLPRILNKEDADAARVVQAALENDGVSILTSATIREVRATVAEKNLSIEAPGGNFECRVDQILVAVGRSPNVNGLGLEAAEVEHDASGVKVNDRLQTTNPRIFAAGDICSQFKFTHAADYQARIVIQNSLFFGRAKASALTIPWCTYTEPEIAHVGLSEQDAKARGISIQTFIQPMSGVDRAILDGQTDGFVKVHLKSGTDQILGATIVADHAGDLISEIALAMVNGVGLKGIGRTIHPYPTQADAIRKLGDQYNRTRLTPRLKWLFGKWLEWQR